MAKVNLIINDQKIAVPAGGTVLEAALEAGIDIPTLCHHPALTNWGACRICLVEIEKQRTLQPACTFPATEGMVVHTESEKVVSARKFVLQLLFSERNHYCMYCQVSGDCELQSLAYRYGLDSWTYPRSYTPLAVDASQQYIVIDHNRCILCRRCVRSCAELVGNHTLGVRERGMDSMISADMNVPFGRSSCIACVTCLHVCPTGALMDRRSAYRGREVKVERLKSTCVACSVGCGVELITRDNHLLRIEGDWDAEVNKGLLCVAGCFEPLSEGRRRVLTPLVRRNGALEEGSWDEALSIVADKLNSLDGTSIAALASPRATNETLNLFAELFKGLGAGSVGSLKPIPDFLSRAEGSLAMLDQADFFVVAGVDLAKDCQVAGFAVRRGVTNRGARLALVLIEAEGIVAKRETELGKIAHYHFQPAEVDQAIALAKGADAPMVIYGAGAGKVMSQLWVALSGKARFLGLVPGTNGRGALAAGINGAFEADKARAVYVLAADDEVDEGLLSSLDGAEFVVAQASYFGPLLERADVVLPTAIWAEKSGTLINTEGRAQAVYAALRPPAGVKDDREILKMLADKMRGG
ncbi:MAG: NADH-quinone oxidoreductase subunit 3 [Dehalococcoidia bacterium]|nr:NADH-quinone oxidoreductase subunit 3 [Chloroflexota bacterium]MBT9162793.1 NADH-quinone oxidoreductase subunit 3 [Chloroflexota bacterium]